MTRMIFVGLGLNDEKGMSLEGLEAVRRADRVFAEFYTNTMPNLRLDKLEDIVGKKVEVLTRKELEDENGERILSLAEREQAVFLVPGDPMVATTHVSLRLALARRGVESRVIHSASIFSAVCGSTGLQSYKFGKSTTLPQDEATPPSVLDVIRENGKRGLHTLLLLELKTDGKPQLTIGTAIFKLVQADHEFADKLVVGVARIGSPDQIVRARKSSRLAKADFGPVPHALVFPGKLHFMEAEALKAFAGATDLDLEGSI